MSNLQYIGQLSLESFNQQVIEATIKKCSETHNPKILEAIKQSWIDNLNKRLNSVKTDTGSHQTKLPSSVREVLEEHKEEEKSNTSEDDEFMDADVVSAQRSNSVSPQLKPVDNKDNEEETQGTNKEKEESKSKQKDKAKGPLGEPDTDVSISDISDLEDEEPETNDLIIGMLDKVTKPSSRRFGPPLWRVKLKYGIMQVNDVEIPFDTLEGEFEF